MTETDIRVKTRLELLRRKLAERGSVPGQAQAGDGTPVVLSDGQRRMWSADRRTRGALLVVQVALVITGALDHQRLQDAVTAVARRHPVLRTTYRADATGEPGLTIHDELAPGWSTTRPP